MGQKRMIGLAERAESYVERESRRRSQNESTQTGLENRQSKQKRINEAIAEHSN